MKILFLCRLYWPHVGGVEKHVEKLCEALSKKHKIIVVCEKHEPSLPDRETRGGIEILRLDGSSKWSVWKWWLSHLYLIKEVEIVHIHDVFWWYLPYRLLFWNKKVFITFHGYEGAGPPTGRQVFWHWLAFKLTKGNICIGDFHRKWYKVRPDFVSYGAV